MVVASVALGFFSLRSEDWESVALGTRKMLWIDNLRYEQLSGWEGFGDVLVVTWCRDTELETQKNSARQENNSEYEYHPQEMLQQTNEGVISTNKLLRIK